MVDYYIDIDAKINNMLGNDAEDDFEDEVVESDEE